MSLKKIMLIAAVLYSGWAVVCSAAALEQYVYMELVGDVCQTVNWSLEHADQYRLTYRTSDEVHLTTTDPTLATLQWRFEHPGHRTAVSARREDNHIHLTGQYNGQSIDRRLKIDEAPWYQATSISLRRLVLANQTRVAFWTIRADTLEAHKLVAVKQGDDLLRINGKEEQAVRIQLRLTGLLAPFWKSDYWFRKIDGVFLRFEGPSGPPGDPPIVVAYRGLAGQTNGCLESPSGAPVHQDSGNAHQDAGSR